MEEILYVKIAQNIPVAKRQVTFHDLATLHCTNKKVVQELNKWYFIRARSWPAKNDVHDCESI